MFEVTSAFVKMYWLKLKCFVRTDILYFIIVREVSISGTTAARGLKFWLQVALLAPISTAWAEIRKSGSGSGKSGKTGFPGPDPD